MKLNRTGVLGIAMIVVGGILAITFGGAYASKWNAEQIATRLLAEGDRVQATVTRSFETTNCGGVTSGRSSSCTTTHYIDFELFDAGGALQSGTAKNASAQQGRFVVGDKVSVLIDRSRPPVFMPLYRANQMATERGNVAWLLPIPTLLLGIGAGILVLSLRRRTSPMDNCEPVGRPYVRKSTNAAEVAIVFVAIALLVLTVSGLGEVIVGAGL